MGDKLKALRKLQEHSLSEIWSWMVSRFCRKTWGFWEKFGFHIVPDHFYYPIPNMKELERKKPWKTEFTGGPIKFNIKKQKELLQEAKKYNEEYDYPSYPGESEADKVKFYFGSGSFESCAAEMYHTMVREVEPETIIEVGAGDSTKIASNAINKNNKKAELFAIEPFPQKWLYKIPNLTDLVERKVEDINPEFFRKKLGADDILFIDGSHVVKNGGDVPYLILQVLPVLEKGVYIHFHDIFIPFEYPKNILLSKNHFWTEQYLLHSFLQYNDSFEVVWSGYFMGRKYPKLLEETFPRFDRGDLSRSFWIKKK